MAFRRAFNEIVRRHEAWRTTFDTVGGKPIQVVQPPPSFDLPLADLSHLNEEEAERQAVRLVAEVSRVPYDVRRGPLLRPRLIRFPGDHHRLYLSLHHLSCDGVSVNRVVLMELIALYDAFCAGRPSPLAEPRTQYADYARWEQNWIAEPRVARRLEHWRNRLTALPVVFLPVDRPRKQTSRTHGGELPLHVPSDPREPPGRGGPRRRSHALPGAGEHLVFVAQPISGQPEVVFATAANLRQRPEFESVVGYGVTPLVLKIELSDDPRVTDLVLRVRNELLDGLDNLVPFERLVRELHPNGVSNANPIYQTMLILEPTTVAPDPAWTINQMESEIGDAVGNFKVDLELQLDHRPEGHIAGRLIYDRDLFDTTTATRMAEHWLHLADAVAADPATSVSRLPILTAAEARRQLVEWNATVAERFAGGVHELVRDRSRRQPEAPAVTAGGQSVSYAELDRLAGQVAGCLRADGIAPGDVVALCAEPSADLVVGALGVLKAGAGYLLLDPALPPHQLDLMVAESGAAATLAQPAFAAAPGRVLMLGAGDDEPGQSAQTDAALPDAVCCWQYTSGATGNPKGVPIHHGAVVNAEIGIGAADTVLVLPRTMFRVSTMELWSTLIAGARMVLAPVDTAGDEARLSQLIAAERATFLHAQPSSWQALIDSGLKATRDLRALSGGGPLSPDLAGQILERCRSLWNGYGAVETGGNSTLKRVEARRR